MSSGRPSLENIDIAEVLVADDAYPGTGFFASVVDNYRAAHRISLSQQQGNVDTEEERQAFVHYRALFEKLLETDKDQDNSQEARA